MAQTEQQPPRNEAPTWKWMPEWLKRIVEGIHKWHLLALFIGEALSYFLGEFRGKIAGYTVGTALFLIWIVFELVQFRWNDIQNAIAILMRETYKDDPEYRKAATGLKRAQLEGILANILFILACIAVVCLTAPPALHWWNKRTPQSIGFAEFSYYYEPKEAENPWEKTPFVEGLIAYLDKEGRAVGEPFKIALGETCPLEHYTPAFQCTMIIENGRYEATGYAFRLHKDANLTLYEPIPAEYPKQGEVIFKVPPSQTGDRMYIIARITSLKHETLPDELAKVAKLEVAATEKKP